MDALTMPEHVFFAGGAERHSALAFATQFGQTAEERGLAAFKAGLNRVTSVLTFLAARRGFAMPASDAATDPLFPFAGALGRTEVC
jgi:hypothetical protein